MGIGSKWKLWGMWSERRLGGARSGVKGQYMKNANNTLTLHCQCLSTDCISLVSRQDSTTANGKQIHVNTLVEIDVSSLLVSFDKFFHNLCNGHHHTLSLGGLGCWVGGGGGGTREGGNKEGREGGRMVNDAAIDAHKNVIGS